MKNKYGIKVYKLEGYVFLLKMRSSDSLILMMITSSGVAFGFSQTVALLTGCNCELEGVAYLIMAPTMSP